MKEQAGRGEGCSEGNWVLGSNFSSAVSPGGMSGWGSAVPVGKHQRAVGIPFCPQFKKRHCIIIQLWMGIEQTPLLLKGYSQWTVWGPVCIVLVLTLWFRLSEVPEEDQGHTLDPVMAWVLEVSRAPNRQVNEWILYTYKGTPAHCSRLFTYFSMASIHDHNLTWHNTQGMASCVNGFADGK